MDDRTTTRRKTAHQQRVEAFMRKINSPMQRVREAPTSDLSEEERILYARLLLEETLETIQALGVAVRAYDDLDCMDLTYPHPDYEPIFKFDTETTTGGAAPKFDLVEAVDGCADVSVIVAGIFARLGVADESVLAMVDESNLAKFNPPTCAECGSPMEPRTLVEERDGAKTTTKIWRCFARLFDHPDRPETDGPHHRPDGKFMKGKDWKKPDLAGLLNRQAVEVGESLLKETSDKGGESP